MFPELKLDPPDINVEYKECLICLGTGIELGTETEDSRGEPCRCGLPPDPDLWDQLAK